MDYLSFARLYGPLTLRDVRTDPMKFVRSTANRRQKLGIHPSAAGSRLRQSPGEWDTFPFILPPISTKRELQLVSRDLAGREPVILRYILLLPYSLPTDSADRRFK